MPTLPLTSFTRSGRAVPVHRWLLSAVLLLCFASCNTESYESGDGKYSYLRADFSWVHTVSEQRVDYAITDGGDSLVLSPQGVASWATKADTLYRALFYYNKVEGAAEPVLLDRVYCLNPQTTSRPDTLSVDPVHLQSVWLSKNNTFLNLGLLLKTGTQSGNDHLQSIGMVCDSLSSHADGTEDVYLTLTHSQNGAPEYYHTRIYASISLKSYPKGSRIHLLVHTYDGNVTKILAK